MKTHNNEVGIMFMTTAEQRNQIKKLAEIKTKELGIQKLGIKVGMGYILRELVDKAWKELHNVESK